MCNVEAHNEIQLIFPSCQFFQRGKLLHIFRYLVGCSVYQWRLKTLLVTLKFTNTRKLCLIIPSSTILPGIGCSNIFLTFTLAIGVGPIFVGFCEEIADNKEAIKLMSRQVTSKHQEMTFPDTACFKVCPCNSPFCQFTFCAVAA